MAKRADGAKPKQADRAADAPGTQSGAMKKAERQAERAARQAQNQAERAARKAERQAGKGSRDDAGAPPKDAREARQADAIQLSAQPVKPARTKPRPPKRADKPVPKARRADQQTRPHPKPSLPRATPPPDTQPSPQGAPLDFDILIVGQGGGIDREAAILAASLRRNAPEFQGRLVVAEPQPEAAWSGHRPGMTQAARAALEAFGAEIRPLIARDFGASYPHGNKIEALALLDPGRPFLFLDSDTLILGDIGRVPFDFARPSASMRRSGTWPQPPEYHQTYDSIWRSLYDRFGLDMDSSLDLSQPSEHWERFLYFNAGWFFGSDAAEFARRFREWAVAVRDEPGEALACQSLDPWLDQVVLPLVIHSLGGGRPGPELAGLDGDVTCHWRNLPLLYARESDRAVGEMEAIAALPEIAPLLADWDAGRQLISDGIGRRRIREMFADDMPGTENAVRKRLRKADLWLV